MARSIGIDIRASHVRAALVQKSYRSTTIEQLREVSMSDVETLEQALQAVSAPMLPQADSLAIGIEAESAFMHRITLPATALKRLDEVLPFELEAQVPVDIDELVYGFSLLKRSGNEPIVCLTAAARTEHVRKKIELVRNAIGREPDRVGCGPMPLANLCFAAPSLAEGGPYALIDLGGRRTEVAVLADGHLVFARALSRGVAGLPESAGPLAAELRQTFVAYMAQSRGSPIQAAYVLGGGASAQGAEEFLAGELGIPVGKLPALSIEGASNQQPELIAPFAKALALALGATGRARDIDLRQGPLAYQRGFAFLKEKIPTLAGLAAMVLIGFVFSTWAGLKDLSAEEEKLEAALAMATKEVLEEEITDPKEALSRLNRAKKLSVEDPMPEVDAFDIMVELSKAVPESITHDVEELDFSRGQARIHGIAGSAADVQLISGNLAEHRCFEEVKVSKITQVVNSDRHKYVLDFVVNCPGKKPKKGSDRGKDG